MGCGNCKENQTKDEPNRNKPPQLNPQYAPKGDKNHSSTNAKTSDDKDKGTKAGGGADDFYLPIIFSDSLSFKNSSNNKKINHSALTVEKYFKNQVPPKDKTKPYTDEMFPPNVDSLLSKTLRFQSLLTGQGKKYLDSKLYGNFNFNYEEIKWYRASEIFPNGRYTIFENKIEVDDIRQGNVGNCYFMSSIAAMCKNPQFIMELFRDLAVTANGCYEVVMRIDGFWQVILIDDYFLCHKDTKKPLFAQANGGELWVMLLEKAWAKANGNYMNIIGGWASEVLFCLTSFPVYNICHRSIKKEDLWQKLSHLIDKENIITCTSKDDPSIQQFGLIIGHSFTITGMKEAKVKNKKIRLLRLRNPWGYKEWSGRWSDGSKEWNDETRQIFNHHKIQNKNEDDGEFYMEFYDYTRFFILTEVCQVSKNVFSKSNIIDDETGGMIFELIIKQHSDIKLQIVKNSGRFHKDIPKDSELNMNMLLFKKDVTEKGEYKFTYIDSVTDALFNPFIELFLEKGVYIVYIFADYTHSNFDKKRKYLLNVTSDHEFKVKKKAVDGDFHGLQEIIEDVIYQIPEYNSEIEDMKNEPLSYCILNRFLKTSFGILYVKNNLQNDAIIIKIKDNMQNMYLLNPKDRPKEYNFRILGGQDYCFLGIRQMYYEEYCFDLEFDYEIEKKEDMVQKLFARKEKESRIAEVMNFSPDSPEKHRVNYFDFLHFNAAINLSEICSVINSKHNAIEVYTANHPEKMKELDTVPELSDYEEVIFYNICKVDEGEYFGEWKIKNSFIKHGRGMLMYSNGNKYVGQYQNDYQSGIGKMIFSKGNVIEITFKDDEMDGIGKKKYKNGTVKTVEYFKNNLVKEYDFDEATNRKDTKASQLKLIDNEETKERKVSINSAI